MEFPPIFRDNMMRLLGDEYDSYEKSFNEKRLFGLRTNRLKISMEDFLNKNIFETTPIPWIDNGAYYDGALRPAKHPYYYAGLYYLQEPSAMTPANRLEIHPGDRVLDLCAAPGGKTTELGAKLGGTGVLFTNDISNSRAQALLKNVELFGIGNAVVSSEAPFKLAKKLPEFFDKILIDAPCSGEGMFRKDPAVMRAWTEKSNDTFAALQREIVDEAAKMLKPGGKLLYSTCTFSPKENEERVSEILEQHPEFHLISIEGYPGFGEGLTQYGNHSEELKKCVRIWPQRMPGEGHFLAYFQKEGQDQGDALPPVKRDISTKELLKQTALFDFLEHIDRKFDVERINVRPNGSVTYLPEELPDLSGLRLMRTGLLLGELKKNRFEPSQALALNLSEQEFDNCISFAADDLNTIKYLKCETLELEENHGCHDGWCLVCVDHYPLGFGKLTGTTLKNKYLSGWRWQ
jgi:NOL1/NOP2/sun family putative RNA methylase